VSVPVTYADADPNGLATLVGGLIEQNLARDPARERLLRPTLVGIEAPDAGVGITVRIDPGGILIIDGADRRARVTIKADAAQLLALTSAPLRLGLPDPLRDEGRAVIRQLLGRRLRVRGLISHPLAVARLTMLLSVS
jgi:hypothetical protein